MKRYLDDLAAADLQCKTVLIAGPRRVGKTTLCGHLMQRFGPSQYLNWDVALDRAVLLRQSWNHRTRLAARGGFREPCLAENPDDADCWRLQYFTDLIREDVVELSRLHELRAMRLFVELLRERAGSPLSLASIARDLGVSPTFDSKTP